MQRLVRWSVLNINITNWCKSRVERRSPEHLAKTVPLWNASGLTGRSVVLPQRLHTNRSRAVLWGEKKKRVKDEEEERRGRDAAVRRRGGKLAGAGS